MKDLPSKEYYCDKIHTSTGVDPGIINRGGSRINFRVLQNFTKKLKIEMIYYAEKL